jgi:hypothetical protein
VKKGSTKKVKEESEDGPEGEIEVGEGVGVKEEVVEDQFEVGCDGGGDCA